MGSTDCVSRQAVVKQLVHTEAGLYCDELKRKSVDGKGKPVLEVLVVVMLVVMVL